MSEVSSFFWEYEDEQRALLLYLHHLFTEEMSLEPKLRYRIPFYYRHSWICYLSPTKDGKVECAFTRGNELSNEQGLLESKGRKQVMSTVFSHVAEVPEQVLREVLQEAILLDETVPYASKRTRKS